MGWFSKCASLTGKISSARRKQTFQSGVIASPQKTVGLEHCFPKWAVPPPWGRCFDIGGGYHCFYIHIFCIILLFLP